MRRNIPHDDESGAFGLAFMGISPLSLALYFCSPCKRLRRAIHRLLSANSVTKMGVPPWPGYAPWPAPACAGWHPWACSCPAHRLTRAHDHMPLGSDALRIFALGHTLVNRIGKHIRAASTAVPSLHIRPLPVSVALTAAKICSAG